MDVSDILEVVEEDGRTWNKIPVVFEITKDGASPKESYSVDRAVIQNGFLVLISDD